MTETHLDDALRELRAELDITPSPEFAAKVRARIAQAAAASRVPRWAIWGALAATAAGVIAIAMTSTSGPTPVSVPAVVTTAAAPSVVPERAPGLASQPAAGRADLSTEASAKVEAPPARRPPAHAALDVLGPEALAKGAPRATTPPVLEVITDQPALIRRAFEQAALHREFPVNRPATPGPIEPLTLTKVVIDPIVIPGGAEPSGGVSPVIRRVSAVDATRSPR